MKSKSSIHVKEVIKPIHTVLHADETIEESLIHLRQHHIDDKIIYFYVVDEKERFVGVVSTRKLLLENPKVKISHIMDKEVFFLRSEQTIQEALEIFERHNLLALPVLDEESKILGIIDVEMYMEGSVDIARARHRSEIFQLIGITLEDEKKVSILGDYKKRIPWIFCNLASGLICAVISDWKEAVLYKVLILAMFIPLVLTLSESISMQSMTHSLQFLRRGKVSWSSCFLRMFKEMKILGLMAVTVAFVAGSMSRFWDGNFLTSLSIGLGLLFSIFLSAGFGMMFPMILHKTKLDPKVASGPLVLMVADIVTIIFYLSIASFFLL